MSDVDPQSARTRAIEASGWGEEFRFVQPRNLAFWMYLLLLGAGTITVFQQWLIPGAKAYSDALPIAVVAYTLYTVPFWLFLTRRDRFGSVPPKLALVGFIYGAFAATGAIALHVNGAVRSLWGKLVNQAFALDWSAALTAPVSEEIAKGSAIILLIALAPRIIRSPFDGLILGAFIGLGFQIMEDISYGVNGAGSGFGADQVAASESTIVLRMVVGIASHWVYSGIFVAGLVFFLGVRGFAPQRGRGLLLMGFALLAHGTWDGVGAIAGSSAALAILLELGIAVALLVVFRWVYVTTNRHESDWARDILAPEVASGVVTAEEVDALVAPRKERKAFVKAGPPSTGHVLEGATDLTLALARDGGRDTPAVAHARAEISRLRG